MKLEDNVSKEIVTYLDVFWDIDRPHSRRLVLDSMFLSSSSGFEWTSNGYLIQTERDLISADKAPPYGVLKCKEFIDMSWLEDKKVKGRRGGWCPTPFSDNCNLLNVPDNVAPDYLEGAYEIALQAKKYFTSYDLSNYPIKLSKEQIMEKVKSAKNQDDDAAVRYTMAAWDGELSLEWAMSYEEKQFQSKIRQMCYLLDDFFERYRELKSKQSKISVYLDDNRPTPKEFSVHVYTAQHVIDLLKFENVYRISLDNDLGPYSDLEGYKVANFIEEKAFEGKIKPLEVYVHSANVVREKEIIMSINQAKKYWK